MIYLLAGLAAIFTAMGLGGGSLLLVLLTSVYAVEQKSAQGLNLVLFIPIAIISVIMSHKNGYLQTKIAVIIGLFGLIGAIVGLFLVNTINKELLGDLMGTLFIVSGIISVISFFTSSNKKKKIPVTIEIKKTRH